MNDKAFLALLARDARRDLIPLALPDISPALAVCFYFRAGNGGQRLSSGDL